jgi:hypothetical protein
MLNNSISVNYIIIWKKMSIFVENIYFQFEFLKSIALNMKPIFVSIFGFVALCEFFLFFSIKNFSFYLFLNFLKLVIESWSRTSTVSVLNNFEQIIKVGVSLELVGVNSKFLGIWNCLIEYYQFGLLFKLNKS